jgi:hypothetical protein
LDTDDLKMLRYDFINHLCYLLQIQTYSYRSNDTADITLHNAKLLLLELYFIKYSASQKFEIKTVEIGKLFILRRVRICVEPVMIKFSISFCNVPESSGRKLSSPHNFWCRSSVKMLFKWFW